MGPQPKPKHDWARHAYRTLSVIDTQVRNLRKRQVVAGYLKGERDGAYWGIRSHIGDYGPPAGSLHVPDDKTLQLAQHGDAARGDGRHAQERLINWGYAICDARMRRWVDTTLPPPGGFPYPDAGVG